MDGETHINIYSQGRTELGRFLSNFTYAPFTLAPYGRFCSIEGFWYFVSTAHPRKEELRRAVGYRAKQLGRELRRLSPVTLDSTTFENMIGEAIRAKLAAHPCMLITFRNSTLPFKHYYVFSDKQVDAGASHPWLLTLFENLREELRANTTL
jgi:hypothetical protein